VVGRRGVEAIHGARQCREITRLVAVDILPPPHERSLGQQQFARGEAARRCRALALAGHGHDCEPSAVRRRPHPLTMVATRRVMHAQEQISPRAIHTQDLKREREEDTPDGMPSATNRVVASVGANRSQHA